MTSFPDQISSVLGRALTLRLDRMHLLASNIANADTPGYTPVDMRFNDMLSQGLKAPGLTRSSERHLPALEEPGDRPALYYDPTSAPGLDGNSVSLDREMVKLSENSVQYDATARALQKKLAMLRYAVNEGGTQ